MATELIADSGSTKTDWAIIFRGKIQQKIATSGINPFFQSKEDIIQILNNELLTNLEKPYPTKLNYYGAGCTFPAKIELLSRAFSEVLGQDIKLSLHSDLVAVAHALCGEEEGIPCILGTGSNSCYWNGKEIVNNVPPLGFILGDEGSGAVLGKQLIANILKGQLSDKIISDFFYTQRVTYEELLESVYKKPFPNRFLARFTYFIKEHIENHEIRQIVVNSFQDFFNRNIKHYPQHLKVHFVGSVAVVFEDILREVGKRLGYEIGNITKAPLEKLAEYHINKQ